MEHGLLVVFLVHHHHPFAVHDGVEPEADGDDSALRELLSDGGLHRDVSLQVHGRGGEESSDWWEKSYFIIL